MKYVIKMAPFIYHINFLITALSFPSMIIVYTYKQRDPSKHDTLNFTKEVRAKQKIKKDTKQWMIKMFQIVSLLMTTFNSSGQYFNDNRPIIYLQPT